MQPAPILARKLSLRVTSRSLAAVFAQLPTRIAQFATKFPTTLAPDFWTLLGDLPPIAPLPALN